MARRLVGAKPLSEPIPVTDGSPHNGKIWTFALMLCWLATLSVLSNQVRIRAGTLHRLSCFSLTKAVPLGLALWVQQGLYTYPREVFRRVCNDSRRSRWPHKLRSFRIQSGYGRRFGRYRGSTRIGDNNLQINKWFIALGPDSISRWHLTSIGNPTVGIRRS